MRSARADFDALPDEIKAMRRWVLWDAVEREGRITKKPRQSTADPDSWLSFDHAFGALLLEGATGIGFVIGDGVIGIDIDGCLAASGKLHEVGHDALKLNSYAETSPGGRGVHVLMYGAIERSRKVGKQGDRPGIEIYDGRDGSARFFACTGRRLSRSTGLERGEGAQRALDDFVAKWLPVEPSRPALQVVSAATATVPPNSNRLNDDAVLDAMFGAKDGAKWKAVFNGDTSQYASHSEADLGLCRKLRFYCRADAAQVDRLFRRSRLIRPKWAERHGASTYGQLTIKKALAAGGHIWTPRAQEVPTDQSDWVRESRAYFPAWWVVRLQGCGELAFRVLATIASYTNAKTGEAFPSIETIAKRCNVSPRRVKAAIATLRDAGLITSEVRARQSSLYRVARRVPEVITPYAAADKASRVTDLEQDGCPHHGTVTDKELIINTGGERTIEL